ncbi:site-specific integrase [Paenibacillus hemerocallicola]|uniref:Site-specific integrase n=1 Tax=Paenibacillus hemerocallicola TaxID=1172614 RepID=A0A5C4TGT7_9BACL|nr:tyrosine-type recombinase/integrase [Paenibacillus hemerocallicola]TNJ68185.1 site-specific integrase [Paenibacillus hemerocallicola]
MVQKKEKKKSLPPGVRERNGRYTYRYSVEVIKDGKRDRKQKETESYPTALEAYNAGILIKADQLKGKLIDEKNITLGQWKERWLEDYVTERDPRPTTIRNRTTALNSFSKHVGEHTRVKDIDVNDYQKWLNKLKKEGRKKGTIKEYHTSVQLSLADAVRKKVIAESPAASAIVPAFKQTLEQIETGELDLPKYLEKKELKHLLSVVRFRGRPQEYEIFTILAYTGLRISELLALKVTDFYEKDRYISITKTLTVITSVKKYVLGPPKNKTSIRKVTIGETVIKAIKSQLAWRDQKIKDGVLQHDADFLFWSYDFPGYPASKTYLEDRFNELLKIAELPEALTPHSLRHTHVTLLAEAREELVVIQERLGHKNDDITKRVYLHVTQKQRELVPDRFEKVMRT